MTSQERVRRAIHFRGVDRIPHYLPDGGENDLIWLWADRPEPRQPWTNQGEHDLMIDCWGTTFQRMAGGRIGRGEVLIPALSDMASQSDFPFPDLNNRKYQEKNQTMIRANRRSENPRYCLGTLPFSSLNEGIHNITGIESMFLAYYECPDELQALIARFASAQRDSIRLMAEMGCDGIMAYDDWGLQDSLMISRNQIAEFFLPHYRENWKLAHDLELDVWLHSCGYILDILPDFIESGLDVIQMDQQENMGLENLASAAGGRLAFWCPVDIQRTMIEGTLDDIEQYVERMIQTLGGFQGGLVSMAYSTPEDVHHTPERLDAMCRAFRKYGTSSRSLSNGK